jgi:hypothetical protein
MPIPGSLKIKPVFDGSAVVCLCRIQAVSVKAQSEPGNNDIVRQTVQIEAEIRQLFKYQSDGKRHFITILVEHEIPAQLARESVYVIGDNYLFFLVPNSTGGYILSDPVIGASRFKSIPAESSKSGLGHLASALGKIASLGDKEDRVRSLQLLARYEAVPADAALALRNLTQEADPEIALWAFAALLRPNAVDSLQDLVDYLDSHNGDGKSWALMIIQGKLVQYRAPEVLGLMQKLNRSRYPNMRLGAMQYLRSMRSRESARTLIERLDDSDSAIRYLAVITLAGTFEKSDGDYAPSMYLFDQKPEYFMHLWRKWWIDEGIKLHVSGS